MQVLQSGHATSDTDQDVQNKKKLKPSDNTMPSTEEVNVIEQVDTLYTIARKTTGNNRKWNHIAEYNHINDPTKIWVG